MNDFKTLLYNKLLNANTGVIPGTRNFYCIHKLIDEEKEEEILYVGRSVCGIRKYYKKQEFAIPLKNSSYKKRKYQGEENITSTIFFNLNDYEKIKIFENYYDAIQYLKNNPNKEDYNY